LSSVPQFPRLCGAGARPPGAVALPPVGQQQYHKLNRRWGCKQCGRMGRKAPVAFGCWQRAEGHEQQKFSGSPGLLPRSSASATGAAAAVPRRAVAFSGSARTSLVDTNDCWPAPAFANAEHVRSPTSVGHRRGLVRVRLKRLRSIFVPASCCGAVAACGESRGCWMPPARRARRVWRSGKGNGVSPTPPHCA
jgi:hypothetical protein